MPAHKSCLILAVEMEGRAITTVESLPQDSLIQKAFIDGSAFRCGYCTSGFLIMCFALKTQYPSQSGEIVVKEWLQSNLCRYTSYKEIRRAVRIMYDDSNKRAAPQ